MFIGFLGDKNAVFTAKSANGHIFCGNIPDWHEFFIAVWFVFAQMTYFTMVDILC